MKKQKTKDIFAGTLLELAEKVPMNRITVTMLVKESGLSSKTFYNHFANIYELMSYVEMSEASRLQEKVMDPGYTYREYLKDGLHLYSSIQSFIKNASQNTSGAESFEKLHAETAYMTTRSFLLKRNHMSAVSEELDFALRLYAFGLVEVYAIYFSGQYQMNDEEFLDHCISNMPSVLQGYLL